jgi:hypothetical protein
MMNYWELHVWENIGRKYKRRDDILKSSSNVHPTPSDFVINPLPTKLNLRLFFPKMVMAPIIHQKNHVIFSKCDNVIENIQIHMSWQSFFLVWNFAQIWKINMKREYSTTFFFKEKIIRFPKNWKSGWNILYWFWFGNNILNVEIGS